MLVDAVHYGIAFTSVKDLSTSFSDYSDPTQNLLYLLYTSYFMIISALLLQIGTVLYFRFIFIN